MLLSPEGKGFLFILENQAKNTEKMQQERQISVAQGEEEALDRRQGVENPYNNGDHKKHASKTGGAKKGNKKKALSGKKKDNQIAKKMATKKNSKHGSHSAINEKRSKVKKNKGHRNNGVNGGVFDFLCQFLSVIPGLSSLFSLFPTSIIKQVYFVLFYIRAPW